MSACWHPSGDDLERFCSGKLYSRFKVRLEIHLLTCASCLRRLAETEQFIGANQQKIAAVPLKQTNVAFTSWSLGALSCGKLKMPIGDLLIAEWFDQPKLRLSHTVSLVESVYPFGMLLRSFFYVPPVNTVLKVRKSDCQRFGIIQNREKYGSLWLQDLRFLRVN